MLPVSSVVETIKNYIAKIKEMEAKQQAPAESGPTAGALTPQGLTTPQIMTGAQQPQYPATPKRSVLPVETEFKATAAPNSGALVMAGNMAKQQRNLEAYNEGLEEKSWFEKMRDTSDIYKADLNLDRDKKRYDYMSDLEKSRQAGRADIEGMRQEGRTGLEEIRQSGRAGIEGMRQESKAADRASREKMADARTRIQQEALKIRSENPSKFAKMAEYVDNYTGRANMEGASEEDRVILYESAWEKAKLEIGGELPKEQKAGDLPPYEERPSTQRAQQSVEFTKEISDIMDNPQFNSVVSQYTVDEVFKNIVDKDGNSIPPGTLAAKIPGGSQSAKIQAIKSYFGVK
jgi:hypothetical protein